MFYSSGNWDTEVFDHPERFDLSRSPNPHLGFGGGGLHFCLGAQWPAAQLRAFFGDLLCVQLPGYIQASRARVYVPGNLHHAVRSMPCYFLRSAQRAIRSRSSFARSQQPAVPNSRRRP